MANSKDGRAVARENEVRVLRALNRFGWLRTRDLAALVWQEWARSPAGEPSLKPATATAAGLRMAQRTLRRLREKRLVLKQVLGTHHSNLQNAVLYKSAPDRSAFLDRITKALERGR